MKAKILVEDADGAKRYEEVQMPHYRKDDTHIFAVVNSEECIWILKPYQSIGRKNASISIAHAGLAFEGDTVEITEKEFINVRNRTMLVLMNMSTPGIKPMTEEMWEHAHEEDYKNEMGDGEKEEPIQE